MSKKNVGFKKEQALVISDVVKEPRTLDIFSEQMRYMSWEQKFELDVVDQQGKGSFYPLLTHGTAPKEAIQYALQQGAVWKEVWVQRGNPVMPYREDDERRQWVEQALDRFLETCKPFCIAGEPKELSYMTYHDYETFTAIFSTEEDVSDFQVLMELLWQPENFEDAKRSFDRLMEKRPEPTPIPVRFKWDDEE